MGPSAILVAGLEEAVNGLGHQIVDVGALTVEPAQDPGDPAARYLNVIQPLCAALADRVSGHLDAGYTPLILGGDHSQAMGSIAGVSRCFARRQERIGVIWVDAHTDMNTPQSSPSGNIHGMPLAVLLGDGPESLVNIAGQGPALHPEDVAVIGVRDVDRRETTSVHESGVRVYSMSEVDRRGIAACVDEAIELVTRHTAGIHLSFDLDGVDPLHAPGVGTPVPGGLNIRESHFICESVAATGKLISLEVVELNPTQDIQNQTAKLAVWLVQSTLGKTIL
jgi:arginase